MSVITAAELASYLRNPDLVSDPSFVQIVSLTNDLIDEAWAAPAYPVPVRITLLGLDVAARAWSFDPTTAHLESYTRTLDDASRTERFRTKGDGGRVYLTAAEASLLRGAPAVRSVRLVRPGDVT